MGEKKIPNTQKKIYLTKLLLKFFIGIINAELFKTIYFECFKAVDVEYANERMRFDGTFKTFVYLLYDPVKEL